MYNAEDDCCFLSALVKPYIFDAIVPFFRLFKAEERFGWHENFDPGDHNYQLDNRRQAYRFFGKMFGVSIPDTESFHETDLKTPQELAAGLPEANLTILGLAKRLAARNELPAAGNRDQLVKVLRYEPTGVRATWALASTNSRGLESRSYRLSFENGLSATAVWLRASPAQNQSAATIFLADGGKVALAAEISDRVNRGEQALSLDILFNGDAAPKDPPSSAFTQLLAASGKRPLEIEAGQLIAAVKWLQGNFGVKKIRVETSGMRSQIIALAAAALEPGLIHESAGQGGIKSFQELLEKPVEYQAAPDLFCLDLYKHFDVDRLSAMAAR
jgi:hypothetical protein